MNFHANADAFFFVSVRSEKAESNASSCMSYLEILKRSVLFTGTWLSHHPFARRDALHTAQVQTIKYFILLKIFMRTVNYIFCEFSHIFSH
jgi:hypothetical protein